MSMTYGQHLDVARKAAANAATILQRYFESGVAATEKSSGGQQQGLVTIADVEAETAIIGTIQQSFPDHAFLAEESASTGDNPDHLWVIDPLDGTNNFAFGIPHFATSVAYWHCGVPAVGVVFDPLKDEEFVAARGCGATLNGTKIQVNDHSQLNQSVVGTGFYYDRGPLMRQTLQKIEKLFANDIRGLRRMGAASLDIAYVACGRFGAFFELTLSPWDYAAACLILAEAGGEFSDCAGSAVKLEQTSALASNGHLHGDLLDLLRAD